MKIFLKTVNQAMWRSHKHTKDLITLESLKEQDGNTAKVMTDTSGEISEPSSNNRSNQNKSYNKTQLSGLILGPALFLITLFILPLPGLSEAGRAVLAITLWVAAWWITEALPLGITSLMPLILLPLMNTVSGDVAAGSYGDSLIFLFIGGFALALALERWNLHERIAITIIGSVGASTSGLVLGFMLATGFLSMWVSNMATIMMMIPIGTAIITKVVDLMKEDGVYSLAEEKKFTKSIIFAIGFGGTIGGSATLIGTPTNLILASLSEEILGIDISFANFFIFAFPLISILMFFSVIYITKIAYPMKIKKIKNGRQFVLDRKRELGTITYEEVIVLIVFCFTAFMWLTRTFVWQNIIPGLSDTMIAMFSGIILHLIPTSRKHSGRILESDSLKQMPWDVLLLVGGGLALASGFSGTDLTDWIGNQLLLLDGTSYIIILAVTILLGIGMTQMTPNTATVTILLPITAALALAVNVHPLPLMTATALGAGFAFMLPIGTPSNAIIFATGKITMLDMIKKGTWLTIFAFVLIMVFVFLVLPVIFGIDLFEYPSHLK